MTVTVLRSETTINDDDRATALIWFAEAAIQRYDELDPVLPLIVPTLCHQTHVDNGTHMALFEQLREAVAERRRFDAQPTLYMERSGVPVSDPSWDRLDEQTQMDVDLAAFDLVHPGPSCVRCRYRLPRQGWRGATRGLFCDTHQQAPA